MKLHGLVVLLVVPGTLGSSCACGARTSVELAELDNGQDVTAPDGAADSPPRLDASDVRVVDGGVDSTRDVSLSDVATDGRSCSNPSDSGPLPPSCAPGGPGMTNCGPCSESCCTSLEVPGGTFYRTYANSGSGPTGEADPATVSGFRLDRYLVTVGRFRQFVAAWNGGYYPAAGSGKHSHLHGGRGLENAAVPGTYEPGWVASNDGEIQPTDTNLTTGCVVSSVSTWTASVGADENLPIDCKNWWEAYAFCIWDGGFLPSEAEWEYVAAGGDQQREYPWGAHVPGTANEYAIWGCYYPGGAVNDCPDYVLGNIAPVGTASLGAARWGQFDLAGDMWEATLDWRAAFVSPCIDCAYLTGGSERGLRGGDSNDPSALLLPTVRESHVPESRYDGNGFRCARTP